MAIVSSIDDGCCRIHLDDAMDISSARDLKATLLQAMQSGRQIHVALDKVTELDVTAIQLLWAAARDAREHSIGFSVTGPPETIRRSLEESGLERYAVFSCPATG